MAPPTYMQRRAMEEGFQVCQFMKDKWQCRCVVLANPEDEVGKEVCFLLAVHGMNVVTFTSLSFLSSVEYPTCTHLRCDLRDREKLQKWMRKIKNSRGRISVFIYNCGCYIRNSESNSKIVEFSESIRGCLVEAFDAMHSQGVRDGYIIVLYSNVDPPNANEENESSPKQIVKDAVDWVRTEMLSERWSGHSIRLLTLNYGVLERETEEIRDFPTNKDVARAVAAILTEDRDEVLADSILGVNFTR